MGTRGLLLIIIVLLLIGAVPAWPYSRGWGYRPSGILGLVAGSRLGGELVMGELKGVRCLLRKNRWEDVMHAVIRTFSGSGAMKMVDLLDERKKDVECPDNG